jgi:hypothetical protein
MNTASNLVFATFYRFLTGQLPITDFAEWIYQNDSIQAALGREWDTELLGFDYRAPNAVPLLRHLIQRIYQDRRPGIETVTLFWQLDVLAAASAFLKHTVGFIDGASRLCTLCEGMQKDCWHDPDFSVFCIIADQADFLPSPEVRTHLGTEALAHVLREEAKFEEFYRTDAVGAARRLIERFQLG